MLKGLQVSHDAIDFFGRLPMRHSIVVTVPIKLVAPDRHVTGLVRVLLSLPVDELIDLVGAEFSTMSDRDGCQIRNTQVQKRRDRTVAVSIGAVAGSAGCREYLRTGLWAPRTALHRARCDDDGCHSRDEHKRQHSQ